MTVFIIIHDLLCIKSSIHTLVYLSSLGPLLYFALWILNYLAFQSLSVPDEDYSRNASCVLNMISTFLFDRCALSMIYDLYLHVVEEFWISLVAVLAVVQGLIIHLSVVAAMDDFVKSNCLFTYHVFFMNEI
jgi:hypothetical protein